MILPSLILKREIDKKHIINATGVWGKVYDCNNNFICVSIERPDLNNQRGISCIPTGTYKCSRDETGRHQYYKIENVTGRDFIEIHVANRPDQLNGCIAFGENWSIMKGNIAITSSKPTLDKFLKEYPEGFYLIIVDETEL